MASDLSGVFNEVVLVFQIPGGYTTDPETGNVVPVDPTPAPVRCWLKTTRDPSIQASVQLQVGEAGALRTFLALRGRCVLPETIPAGVTAGMESPLTLRGMPGTFRLAPMPPALLQEVEDALGQEISGVWEAA